MAEDRQHNLGARLRQFLGVARGQPRDNLRERSAVIGSR